MAKARAKEEHVPNAPTINNRQARFRYFIEESFEAGLQLLGPEVKSIRAGDANLTDSYVRFHDGQAYLTGCHIGAYKGAAHTDHVPMRDRKLLMHRRELDRLMGKVRERGMTLVCTKLYFKNGRIKAEVALAKGKKSHDKRESIREREHRREMDRAMKTRR